MSITSPCTTSNNSCRQASQPAGNLALPTSSCMPPRNTTIRTTTRCLTAMDQLRLMSENPTDSHVNLRTGIHPDNQFSTGFRHTFGSPLPAGHRHHRPHMSLISTASHIRRRPNTWPIWAGVLTCNSKVRPAEYHSWVHQQLPPQPVLDQPPPQQQSLSGWSSTTHCHPVAPLPADVVPPLNIQHVSLASETMTNLLSNQAAVSTISTSMLSSCFSSFAPVSVCDEAGTTSLTNKSVVLGRAAMPEETISQSEPSFASAPQSLQNTHMDVEVVKMSSKTMAGDLNFTTMSEKFKKDQVLGHTGESNRLQLKSTGGTW